MLKSYLREVSRVVKIGTLNFRRQNEIRFLARLPAGGQLEWEKAKCKMQGPRFSALTARLAAENFPSPPALLLVSGAAGFPADSSNSQPQFRF